MATPRGDGLPDAIKEQLVNLNGSAKQWREMDDLQRAIVARECKAQLKTMPVDWVDSNLRVLGLDPGQSDAYNTAAFDPFLFVSTVASWLNGIADELERPRPALDSERAVREPTHQGPRPGTAIYEMGALDENGSPGTTIELWTDDALPAPSKPVGGVCVVLGAGNYNFLTFCDVLDRAFMHKEAVFLKHHPLRPHMYGAFAHVLAPLAAAGAFAHCTDKELGRAHTLLLQDKAVTHVHFTGSAGTHDKVIKALSPSVTLTAELSNITPWIVCPGAWDEKSVRFHARMLALSFKSMCSMLCLAPKVLVLPTETAMPQRPLFLERLRAELADLPQLPPYYPGAHDRYAAFLAQYPTGVEIDAPPAQASPLVEGVYPGQDLRPLKSLLVDVGTLGKHSRYACDNEAFAPVLAIATVDATAEGFPLAAAKAVNQYLHGTLTCNIMYPDLTELGDRDPALDEVIAELKYGSVAVNMWSALQYANPLGVWGGYPGTYNKSNPQSGAGFVGNVAGIPKVAKSVVFSPFVHQKTLKEPMPTGLAHFLFALVTGQWSYLMPSFSFCRCGDGPKNR